MKRSHFMGWPLTILTLALITMLAGIELIRRGRRGRQIDDHPICGMCGFDLFGLPSDSTHCSECGADLRAVGNDDENDGDGRAVIRGQRETRRGLLALGCLLSCSSIALLGIPTYKALNRDGPPGHRPVWALLFDARSTDIAVRSNAINELLRRLQSFELDYSAASDIVDEAIAQQAQAQTWDEQWGDFVVMGHERLVVDKERWHQFLKGTNRGWKLAARTVVEQGGYIPYTLKWEMRDASKDPNVSIRVSAALDKEPSKYSEGEQPSYAPWCNVTACESLPMYVKSSTIGAIGPHTLYVTVRLQADPFTYDIHLSTPVVLCDQQDVDSMITAIDDASEAEHIKALLRVDILRDGWSTVRVGRTPHPLAFDVFLVVDGAEHYVTNLNLAAERMNVFYFQLPKWVSGDRVGIVFRPSARAARFSVDLTQYWNGTIEFKDLPVQKN